MPILAVPREDLKSSFLPDKPPTIKYEEFLTWQSNYVERNKRISRFPRGRVNLVNEREKVYFEANTIRRLVNGLSDDNNKSLALLFGCEQGFQKLTAYLALMERPCNIFEGTLYKGHDFPHPSGNYQDQTQNKNDLRRIYQQFVSRNFIIEEDDNDPDLGKRFKCLNEYSGYAHFHINFINDWLGTTNESTGIYYVAVYFGVDGASRDGNERTIVMLVESDQNHNDRLPPPGLLDMKYIVDNGTQCCPIPSSRTE